MSKMLRRLLGEHIELVIALPETLPRVRVDRGQLEQVVMNLAVNARDAMPRGGKLSIALTDVVLDDAWVAEHIGCVAGRHVRLGVSDEGCGMDPETLARSFEPFFTTKPILGTGLGLPTVLGIVQQSGGTDRVGEIVRLRRAIRHLRLPVDLIVASEGDITDWGGLPGTIYYWALREGTVLHEKAA